MGGAGFDSRSEEGGPKGRMRDGCIALMQD